MERPSFFFACIASLTFSASFSSLAHAGPPVCPASLGAYETTVTGNTVVICPTVNPNPSSPTGGCPFLTGMIRVDVTSGDAVELPLQSCVPAPAGSPAINCFEDECVPPGTYEYGYPASPFAGCEIGGCVGPTSGERATVVTVSNPLSNCTPTNGADISTLEGAAPWTYYDAGPEDGGLYWSRTCCAPAPPPDGGSCAYVNWADSCAVEWAPCDADAGDVCPWFYEDGGLTFGTCPGGDAGPSSAQGDSGGAGADASTSGDAGPATTNGGAPTRSDAGGGGGCSVAQGTTDSFAPFFLLSIVGLWRGRRRGRTA